MLHVPTSESPLEHRYYVVACLLLSSHGLCLRVSDSECTAVQNYEVAVASDGISRLAQKLKLEQ